MNETPRILTPDTCSFSRGSGGILGLVIDGELIPGRITARRMFPVSRPRQFLSIRDKDDKEIGVIRDLAPFPPEVQTLLDDDARHHYFVPEITRILVLKDEQGYYHWDVDTNRGRRGFYTKGPSESVRLQGQHRIFITDVEDCKYEIPDLRRLPRSSQALLDEVT